MSYFYTHWKSQNQSFADVFKGYRNRALAWKRLICKQFYLIPAVWKLIPVKINALKVVSHVAVASEKKKRLKMFIPNNNSPFSVSKRRGTFSHLF